MITAKDFNVESIFFIIFSLFEVAANIFIMLEVILMELLLAVVSFDDLKLGVITIFLSQYLLLKFHLHLFRYCKEFLSSLDS
jgi:hypothetical protein